MNFDTAFDRLIGHEGGYVNNPADPGGETNFGISKRSYPNEDIKNLTLTRAKQIYKRDFWVQSGCDVVPDKLKFLMFDAGVNSGPKKAIKMLQASVGEVEDGVIGARTLQAINSCNTASLAARLSAHRLKYMATLPNWPAAGRGWAIRVANNILESV